MEDKSNAEITWKLRSLPPAHYTFKIENFSLLSDAKAECFQKLSVYPGGNKEKNGDGYISLYLVLSKSNELTFNQEVNVYFKLFVYDYIRDSYWTVQDADEKVRRFRGVIREWGFDKLVSITDFKDGLNGYLVNDCCIFCAEILVIENANKGECLSMVKKPENNTYTWRIENFSALDLLFTVSKEFAIGGRNWSITVYPKRNSRAKDKSLSIFLDLKDIATFKHGRKLYTEFMFRVRNQLVEKHHEMQGINHQFESSKNSYGYQNFMSLIELNDKSKGFIYNNTLVVEVEIQALVVIKGLS
ncbi:uncharacterized protein LOC126661582 [Mercurialis annua]|uniref:uncharacterized protein LOC126661582 n=1 Tax=Mercurialis annua TaxID=3986 RepID=UPI00215F252D|nr:uncharacterized protein LOC126661582 [Mercurialis annua]